MEEKKKKWINISIYVGLVVLILFVIITSIILNNENKHLKDLEDKNNVVKPEIQNVRIIDM